MSQILYTANRTTNTIELGHIYSTWPANCTQIDVYMCDSSGNVDENNRKTITSIYGTAAFYGLSNIDPNTNQPTGRAYYFRAIETYNYYGTYDYVYRDVYAQSTLGSAIIPGQPTIWYGEVLPDDASNGHITVNVYHGSNAIQTDINIYPAGSNSLLRQQIVGAAYGATTFYNLEPGHSYRAEAFSVSSTGNAGPTVNTLNNPSAGEVTIPYPKITDTPYCNAERGGYDYSEYYLYCDYYILSPYTTEVQECDYIKSDTGGYPKGGVETWVSYKGDKLETSMENNTGVRYRARFTKTGYEPSDWVCSEPAYKGFMETPIPESVTITEDHDYVYAEVYDTPGLGKHFQIKKRISGVWETSWSECSSSGNRAFYPRTSVAYQDAVQFQCEYTATGYQPGGWQPSVTWVNTHVYPGLPTNVSTSNLTPTSVRINFTKGTNANITAVTVNGVTVNTSGTYADFTGLTPETTYPVSVQSVSVSNDTATYTGFSFRTPSARPANFTEFNMVAGQKMVIPSRTRNCIVVNADVWNRFTAKIKAFQYWKGKPQSTFTSAISGTPFTSGYITEAKDAMAILGITVNFDGRITKALFVDELQGKLNSL